MAGLNVEESLADYLARHAGQRDGPVDQSDWCCGKPYEPHDFRFLRQRIEACVQHPTADIFYCTRCLLKREIPA